MPLDVQLLAARLTSTEAGRLTTADVLVDSRRFVAGPPTPATGLDLRLIGVVLEHDGEVVVAVADRIGGVEIGCA